MKHKKIAVIFLGDYRYDGRCFNMVNSMVAEKYLVDIYHVSKNSNQPGHIQSNRLKVLTINPVSTKILKYVHWSFLVYNIIKKKTQFKIQQFQIPAPPRRSLTFSNFEVCFSEASEKKLKYLIVDTGTQCNFACRTCGPWSSTGHIKEWKDKNGETWHNVAIDYNKLLEQDLSNVKNERSFKQTSYSKRTYF